MKTPPVELNDFGHWVSVTYWKAKRVVYEVVWDPKAEACVTTEHVVSVWPDGTVRCLVIGIDRDYTSVGEDFATEWAAAQDNINAQHSAFASSTGQLAPIVQFQNTNVVYQMGQLNNVDPRVDPDGFRAELTKQGHDLSKYDQTIVLDLDTRNSQGGFNGGSYTVINWYNMEMDGDVDIVPAHWQNIAAAVYHHELGHAHGWQHHWSDDPSTPFITYPSFYGWTDLDNDGVIEIRDATPYGSP